METRDDQSLVYWYLSKLPLSNGTRIHVTIRGMNVNEACIRNVASFAKLTDREAG